MSWIDDLITAGAVVIGGGIGWGAAVTGARIGASATREASIEAFKRQREQEHNDWRMALWQECYQNIHLDTELSPVGLWTYETSILREALRHASAFTATVLQRVVWARTANEKLEQSIADIGTRRRNFGTMQGTIEEGDEIRELRRRFIGEISEIEKALREFAPKDQ